MYKKLVAYDISTQKNDLVINWDKVNILTKNINAAEEFLKTYRPHIIIIKVVRDSKILGRQMSSVNKMDKAVNDRLNKAKAASQMVKIAIYSK